MAYDPTPAIWFAVVSRLLISMVISTDFVQDELEPCDKIVDMLTGCASFISGIMSIALGTVPGAHWAFNAVLATVANVALVWALATLIRGN